MNKNLIVSARSAKLISPLRLSHNEGPWQGKYLSRAERLLNEIKSSVYKSPFHERKTPEKIWKKKYGNGIVNTNDSNQTAVGLPENIPWDNPKKSWINHCYWFVEINNKDAGQICTNVARCRAFGTQRRTRLLEYRPDEQRTVPTS
jgi:hypothetical protein